MEAIEGQKLVSELGMESSFTPSVHFRKKRTFHFPVLVKGSSYGMVGSCLEGSINDGQTVALHNLNIVSILERNLYTTLVYLALLFCSWLTWLYITPSLCPSPRRRRRRRRRCR